jgi:hypothetical protein
MSLIECLIVIDLTAYLVPFYIDIMLLGALLPTHLVPSFSSLPTPHAPPHDRHL